MSERLRTRWPHRAFLAVVALVATLGLTLAATGAAAGSQSETGLYIVGLTGKPALTYSGGVAGYEATKPGKGQKIDPQDAKVANYVGHLNSRHDAVLNSVGGGEKLYDYTYAYNGFTAKLTDAQVAALEKESAVASIEPVEQAAPDTSTTPAFLGLTGPNGLWAQLGGPGSGTNAAKATGAGEGIVVGMLDTGIWPESASVSDRINGKLVYGPVKGWHGHCTSAEQAPGGSWDANLCNKKLIGARYYINTFEAAGTVLAPNDFRSPRDSDGHGSNTSTIAAGNFGVEPTGAAAGFGAISGMAPRARIATYKVCWDDGNPNTGGCFNGDAVAAFDQAVADGVDVINFSIGGTTTSFLNVVEVAAFNAAQAGVFVAMSAGNDGPTASTVAHPSPWLTTVAADTHPRPANGVVTLGSGAVFTGVSQTKTTTGPFPLIRAQDAGLPGVNANLLRQCFSSHEPLGGNAATLDPAKVAGKIVVCERGGAAPNNARVDKSRAVLDAGGVGMILINSAAGASLNGDFHFVPTVHLDNSALATIQAYAQTAGATATIAQGSTAPVDAPLIAAFSSRGPSSATFDQLKPDVAAPGVDILAAYSPASLLSPGFDFNLVSGTSQASPHVAGIAALLMQKHPDWTPAMIKSALMTTGENLHSTFAATGTASADANRAFAQGAGHVRPTLAADPGLVFANGPVDWIRFICGVGQLSGDSCTGDTSPIDPSDLNIASITIGDMAGSQMVTRTVTSVGSTSEMYTASTSGLTGVSVSLDNPVFTIAPGATQALQITFTRTTAPLNVYQSGFLTLAGSNGHSVRLPLTVRPVSFQAPLEVSLGAGNAATWTVKSGVGPESITLGKRGLIPATTDTVNLLDDPDDTFDPTKTEGTFSKDVVVPAGTAVLRASTFDADTDGNDDLDVRIYRVGSGGALTLVASSAGPTAEETATLRNPSAATYRVFVHAFATDGPDVNFTLFTWVLGTADAGNMTVNGPFAATIGSSHTVNLTTTGLAAGTRYLGQIAYSGSVSGAVGTPTIVSGKAS
jgi:subtilase family protein/fibronectin type III domain protein/PA domain-containing protein/peptidase inhibitor I9